MKQDFGLFEKTKLKNQNKTGSERRKKRRLRWVEASKHSVKIRGRELGKNKEEGGENKKDTKESSTWEPKTSHPKVMK